MWLVLPEMQRGRAAESAQAGRGNLQTQAHMAAGSPTSMKLLKDLNQRGLLKPGGPDLDVGGLSLPEK